MRKVRVLIRLKPTLMDAQGVVVRKALNELGYDTVTDVRIGKLIELTLNSDGQEAQLKTQVEEMCARLLANPVIEEYEVIVE